MTNKQQSYTKQTRNRMVIGFLVILFTLGIGLIWIVYGKEAAFLGFICLVGISIPISLIALFLFGLGKISDSNKP